MPLLTDQQTLQREIRSFYDSLEETRKTIQLLQQITNAGKQLQTLHHEASSRFNDLQQQYTLHIKHIEQSKQDTQALIQELQTTRLKMQEFLSNARRELDHFKEQTEINIKQILESSRQAIEENLFSQYQSQKEDLRKKQEDFLHKQAIRLEGFRDETSKNIGAFETRWQITQQSLKNIMLSSEKEQLEKYNQLNKLFEKNNKEIDFEISISNKRIDKQQKIIYFVAFIAFASFLLALGSCFR